MLNNIFNNSLKKRMHFFLMSAVIFAASISCSSQIKSPNVILLIGDGMGIGIISASVHSMDNSPFHKFPTTGLVNTACADTLITDSGAGVTAIATGHRTNHTYLGNDPDGKPLENIMEYIRPLGYSTGIITTACVTDATPAGFVAHLNSMYKYFDIAEKYINSNVDVVIGGGLDKFLPVELGGKREDDKNLISKIKDNGFLVFDSWSELSGHKPSQKFYALLENDQLPHPGERNYSLKDLTNIALDFLAKDQEGFFLMIESAQIDDMAHEKNSLLVKEEMNDFNTAINASLKFAEENGNTLVIVSADHETGGTAVLNADKKTENLRLEFSHNNHTGNLISIFSYGPGHEKFGGLMDNHIMGQRLFQLFHTPQ